MRKSIFFLINFLILSFVSQVLGAAFGSYFPLQNGATWEYQFKVLDLKSQQQIGSGKAVKKNLPATELKGTKVVPQVYTFSEPTKGLKQEATSYIGQDAAGFYVVARKGASGQEPQILPEKYYVLKFPLNQGASWKQQAEGFVLEDTVVSADAQVQVPAGAFRNCLLIKKLYFSPKNPTTPVKETEFWFAPEVGNVKVVIKNLQENKEIVQELQSYKK